jgi:hypothetical protein
MVDSLPAVAKTQAPVAERGSRSRLHPSPRSAHALFLQAEQHSRSRRIAIPRRGPRLTTVSAPRQRVGTDMRTLQLYAIWIVISIGVAGAFLAWRLM